MGMAVLPLILPMSAKWPLGKLAERRGDLALGAPVHHADGAHPLDLETHAHAFAAQNAVAVTLGEAWRLETHLPGHFLEGRHFRTAGQQEVHDQAAAFPDFLSVGLHHEPVRGRIGAGCGELGAGAVGHFHKAQAAAAVGLEAFLVAQGGNGDTQLSGGFEDGGAFGDFDGLVVNGQGYHVYLSSFEL